MEVLLGATEKIVGAKTAGQLYKIYRLLSEYAHFGFFRTVSYPNLGTEAPDVLEKRRELFLGVTNACALSLPCFAHCPPACGFDDENFEKITRSCQDGWRKVGNE